MAKETCFCGEVCDLGLESALVTLILDTHNPFQSQEKCVFLEEKMCNLKEKNMYFLKKNMYPGWKNVYFLGGKNMYFVGKMYFSTPLSLSDPTYPSVKIQNNKKNEKHNKKIREITFSRDGAKQGETENVGS